MLAAAAAIPTQGWTETFHAVGNSLFHFFGISGTGPRYAFWSGTGSDIGEVTIIGGAYMFYRKHNCSKGGAKVLGSKGCWRIGKHPTADGLYALCHRHHPDVPTGGASLEHIHAAHAAAKAAKDAATV